MMKKYRGTPRACLGCSVWIEQPAQAQKYCTPSCRRRNYVWDSEHADCVLCFRNKKYRGHSYCLECLQAKRHGLTSSDVEDILLSQHYRCLICLEEIGNEYQIDHDHACCNKEKSCGKCVRGILHRDCNKSLGNFKDDPARLRRAAEYIERYLVKL